VTLPPVSPGVTRGRAVAAVDCGTNSTRLLVAGADGESLERLMRITRLGESVDRSGRLGPEAIRRTLEVLGEYRQVLDRHGVAAVMATATSAVRDASNSDEFLDEAARVIGTGVQVLSGHEEGRLSYRGATSELDPRDGPFLVVDVGGGSTELVAARSIDGGTGVTEPVPAGDVVAVSLQVGCVRLTERFLQGDPPSPEQLASGHDFVAGLVTDALAAHPELGRPAEMVGLAGTVSTLAMLKLGLSTYDRHRVHHSRLTRREVDRLICELAAVDLEQRLERPGMEPGRADVIIGGAVVLEAVMDAVGRGELLVSESDILDGMVAELLEGRAVPYSSNQTDFFAPGRL
jgi:exopolyphosphatase/guanosine-5'-triphosphate,3'-diphosphate pyrophosphatase